MSINSRVITSWLPDEDSEKFDFILNHYPEKSVSAVVRHLIQKEFESLKDINK